MQPDGSCPPPASVEDDADRKLRDQLLTLLRGEGARMPFKEAVADFPGDAINRRGPNFPFSPWQLLEHVVCRHTEVQQACDLADANRLEAIEQRRARFTCAEQRAR